MKLWVYIEPNLENVGQKLYKLMKKFEFMEHSSTSEFRSNTLFKNIYISICKNNIKIVEVLIRQCFNQFLQVIHIECKKFAVFDERYNRVFKYS